MGIDAPRDGAAEELAADTQAAAAGEHRAGRLPLEGGRVDTAFSRHNQRGACGAGVPRALRH